MFNKKTNKIAELEEIIFTYQSGLNALARIEHIDSDVRSYLIYLLARDESCPMDEEFRFETIRIMQNLIRAGEIAEKYEDVGEDYEEYRIKH